MIGIVKYDIAPIIITGPYYYRNLVGSKGAFIKVAEI